MLTKLRTLNSPQARELARRMIEDRPLAAILADAQADPEMAARAARQVMDLRSHYDRLLAGEAEGDRLDLGASETVPELEAPDAPTAADLWEILAETSKVLAETAGIARGLVATHAVLLRMLGPTVDLETVRHLALASLSGAPGEAYAAAVVCALTDEVPTPTATPTPH